MAIKNIKDMLITFRDFLKLFFFFRYLLSEPLILKKRVVAIYAFVYFCVVALMFHSPEIGWYTPLLHLPTICFLMIIHGMKLHPKNIVMTIVIWLLICQLDSFISSILKLTPLKVAPTYASIFTALICLPLFYALCKLCAAKQIGIAPDEHTLFISTQIIFFILDFTLTGAAGNILKASNDPFYSSILDFTISALALILDISGLQLFFLLQAVRRYRETQKLQEQLLRSQDSYVKQVLQQDHLLREFRHNVRGHMICLDNYLDTGRTSEAKNYIREIENNLGASSRVDFYTKNPVADALLNDRSPELKKQNIRLNVTGFLPEQLPLEDYDLCMLLFNLINNAQEACLRLPEKESRWIRLKFDSRSACLYIQTQNPIKTVNRSLRTSKGDSTNHGLGLSSIRRCVEKCHGTLEISQENGIFQTEIFLYPTDSA